MKIETDESFYKSEAVYQRSSAIKTFSACSWSYYCNYVLKIPHMDNEGALQGNVCHSFFECLLNPRHKKHWKPIVKAGTVCASSACERLVRKLIRKNKLPSVDKTFNRIDGMILVGLKADFYVKGGKLVGKEWRFKIENESPKYRIYGTIDKINIIEKDKVIQIDDFKSSKQKYSGEDAEAGIQALIYSLACKKKWPDYKPKMRFIFLQFPDDPFQEVEFSDDVLAGFEHYLENTQKKFEEFTEQHAYLNFAFDQGMPKDGSFSGALSCGFAKRPNQLKKDGTPMWHCPFKFAYTYYIVKKDGKIIKSYLNKEDIRLNDGEIIEEARYEGCPRFRDKVGELPDAQVVKPVVDNFLDDF